MKKNGVGGERTKTGLLFKERVDIKKILKKIEGYELKKTSNNSGYKVFYKGNEVARCFQKHEFYRFIKEFNVDLTGKNIFPNNCCQIMVYLSLLEILYL